MNYIEDQKSVKIELLPYDEGIKIYDEQELNKNIFDLNCQIDLLSSHADKYDYMIAAGSGLLCGIADILWVGEFSLERGNKISGELINSFVIRVAKFYDIKINDLQAAVKKLEYEAKMPSDGNMYDFGGGTKHRLNDFAHHPTIVGLFFALLTQFTGKAFGTDKNGNFIILDIPDKSKVDIESSIPEKIIQGTLKWFLHLVSDMAGSNGTAGKELNAGTGIPGPILSLAKELSALPFFKNVKIKGYSVSDIISKLFYSKQSKFDFRAEFGIAIELCRASLPVLANECIVRLFYFLRRLGMEIKEKNITLFEDLNRIEWSNVKPVNNPTLARMLTISTGVFTTVDAGEAIYTRQILSVNFIGVIRFGVAIGTDVVWCLKARNTGKIKSMFEDLKRFTYFKSDENMHEEISAQLKTDKLALNIDHVEILYNIEYLKTANDIENTKVLFNNYKIKKAKQDWLDEWKTYITKGFSKFMHTPGARIRWYKDENALRQRISFLLPSQPWLRLVLLEAMVFEPYYPLCFEKDKEGKTVPHSKYKTLLGCTSELKGGYKQSTADKYLDTIFSGYYYYEKGYIHRLRGTYESLIAEISNADSSEIHLSPLAAAVVIILCIAASVALQAAIDGAFTNSSDSSLHHMSSLDGSHIKCAYLGSGLSSSLMACGGNILNYSGQAELISNLDSSVEILNADFMSLQSTKLLTAIQEIFVKDANDIAFANDVCKQYSENTKKLKSSVERMKNSANSLTGKDKKELEVRIKNLESTVHVMESVEIVFGKMMKKNSKK